MKGPVNQLFFVFGCVIAAVVFGYICWLAYTTPPIEPFIEQLLIEGPQ